MTFRERVRAFVDNPRFQYFIIGVIVLNAIVLGCETSTTLMERYGDILTTADEVALSIFVMELVARLYAYGLKFFRDPWNWFDFIIVTVSLVPTGGSLSVLRSFRILRALRLASTVPSMRRVVGALMTAIPGLLSLVALLVLVLYIGGVVASNLFGSLGDDRFADLGSTLLTLFQVITDDGWSDVMRDVMIRKPLAWIFFLCYVLVGAFVMVNLFIGVVCSAMESEISRKDDEADSGAPENDRIDGNAALLAEVRALRTEIHALRDERYTNQPTQ